MAVKRIRLYEVVLWLMYIALIKAMAAAYLTNLYSNYAGIIVIDIAAYSVPIFVLRRRIEHLSAKLNLMVILTSLFFGISLFTLANIFRNIEYYIFYGIDQIIESFKELKHVTSRLKFHILSILISTPYFEEKLFRQILLENFNNHYSSRKAIALAAIIFSIAHLSFEVGFISQLIIMLIFGILLGYIYLVTKNIWFCVTIHFFYNLNNYSLRYLLFKSNFLLENGLDVIAYNLVFLLITIMCCLIGFILLKKYV